MWQNANISILGGVCRKILYNIICVTMLVLGGLFQYGLALFQNRFE